MSNGRLELILGCMYSGKTTELIRLMNRYKSINKNMLAINYKNDTRYGNDNKIYTHNKDGVEALHIDELGVISEKPFFEMQYRKAEIIFINEGQFFSTLYDFCKKAVEVDFKTVIVCGLDGDFRREAFGDMLQLIPIADKVTRLTALCKRCNDGTAGIFTLRTINSSQQTLIGGEESYIPVCRHHYLENYTII